LAARSRLRNEQRGQTRMVYQVRKGALTAPVSDTMRSVSAPWLLDYFGQPIEMPIRPGEVGIYLEDAQILHIRNEDTGASRTVTPAIHVTLDHGDNFFDVQFRDPADQRRGLPSVMIRDNTIIFDTKDDETGYTLSNRAMFETFCDVLSSPTYNPFEAPIPPTTSGLCADVQKRTLLCL